MKLLHLLATKSWSTDQGKVEEVRGGEPLRVHQAKLGLWVFLGVVTSLMSLLVSAYLMRMRYGDWQPMPLPWQLWLNTAVLVLSSLAMQRARVAMMRGALQRAKNSLLAGGALTLAFLAGQLWAWQQMEALGFLVATNPANSFFYLITGLHGLHLLGGLGAWLKALTRIWGGGRIGDLSLSVELCALYWHFLLLVWMALFSVLLLTG